VRILADGGWRVRVLSRRDPFDPLWLGVTPQVVPGAMGDPRALAALCDGADAVIHAAGVVKAPNRAAFDAINVDGARQIADAAAAAGTPHLLLVSSLSAREDGLSHYSASKRAGEVAAAEVAGTRLTVARPCAIYGPGDRELLAVFQAAAVSPLLPVLSPTARLAMVHVQDAARQIAALAATRPCGRTFAVCDSNPSGYLWRDLMIAAARACGRSPRLAPIPKAFVQAIGITNDFTALFGGSPMLTSAKARELLHPDWSVSAGELAPGRPQAMFDLAGGFSDTVAWYRSAAWMKQ
jgi:nucleoside-diphosphate-sugar epimerase